MVNPKSASNQSSKPCTVLQYASRKERNRVLEQETAEERKTERENKSERENECDQDTAEERNAETENKSERENVSVRARDGGRAKCGERELK